MADERLEHEIRMLKFYISSMEELLGVLEQNSIEQARKLEFRNIILSTQQETSLDGIIVADENDKVLSYNGRYLDIWKLAPEMLESKPHVQAMKTVAHKLTDPEGFIARLKFLYENRGEKVLDEIIFKDGRIINRYTTPVFGNGGTYFGRVWYLRDVTEQKEAEKAEHRKAEEEMRKLSLAVEGSSDWILITDRNGKIEYVNHAVEAISGYDKKELIGQNPRIFKSGKHDKQFYKELRDTILSGRTFSAIIMNRKKNGGLFEVFNTITPLKDDKGNIIHFVSTAKDITQQKLLEEKLLYLANYDVLTELPNKNLFIDRLNQTLARAEYNKRLVTILSIDIDKFSFINDTFGSGTGDKLLQEFGKRLFSLLREGDTVARIGSDEFGVSLIDIASFEDTVMLAEKIMESIRQPFRIDGEEIILTTSIGISCYPQDGKDASELLKNSNMVMLKAKASGMNNYQFYTDDINKKAAEFVRLEGRLFNALKNDEFLLYYQPYFDTYTTEMSGMESLLRWNSPEFGLISPGEFIPVLEETGLIVSVGQWALKTACRQLREWQDKGYRTVPVAVNFSAVQFRQKDLADLLEKTIGESRIDPQMLSFEMTESAFMQDVEFTKSVLDRIKKSGIHINIDDFGTGYSSLSYLKKLPIDNLKIDISFVRGIADNRDDRAIASAIISMAHNLNMKTIAEGVETEEQLKILRQLGCDMIQGFYFSRPLPSGEIEKILQGS